MSKNTHQKKTKAKKSTQRSKTGIYILSGLLAVALLLCAAFLAFRASGKMVVETVDGHKVTQAELQYYYSNRIEAYRKGQLRYGSEIAFDPSVSLKKQSCPLSYGLSWHAYFVDQALQQIAMEEAACQEAESAGYDAGTVEKALDRRMQQLSAVAASQNMTEEEYLKTRYGNGLSPDMVKRFETRSLISDLYYAECYERYSVPEEEIEERFQKNRMWNMTASYLIAELECSVEEAKTAEQDFRKVTDQETFVECCRRYNPSLQEAKMLRRNVSAEETEDYVVSSWVFDAAREHGDVTAMRLGESTDNEKLVVLYFLEASRDESATCRYEETFLMPDLPQLKSEETVWGIKEAAAEAYDNLSEEEYLLLALSFSENSGYRKLTEKSVTVQEAADLSFGEWLLSDERKPGDITVLEEKGGILVIRFAGEGDVYWHSKAEAALKDAYISGLRTSLQESLTVSRSLFYSLLT